MSEHAGLDALADLLAGEGSTETEAHLRDCPTCAQALGDLDAALVPVTAALAALPEPEPAPELVQRIETAIAQERAATAPGPSAAPLGSSAAPSSTVTPLGAARSRRTRWLPALSGIAAAAALVTGGVVFWSGSGSSSSDSTALSAGARTFATSNTGTDYLKDGQGLAAALPGLLAGPTEAAKAAGTPATLASDTAGGASSLEVPAPNSATVQGVDPLTALRAPATLAACLAGLTDAADPGLPLALDYAQFEGQPALVVVLPTTKPGKVDVFVVGAACTQADAHLLFFTRLDRPA